MTVLIISKSLTLCAVIYVINFFSFLHTVMLEKNWIDRFVSELFKSLTLIPLRTSGIKIYKI